MSKTVRAKFRVHNITKHDWATEVSLSPVYSEDPKHENKTFWDATPSGEIRMTIKNEAAAMAFEPNKEYYVDFIPAQDAPG